MPRDLAAAGIADKNCDGQIADFHALRHSYITEIVRAGASMKEAQTLARHSTPELTFLLYAHARLHDLERTLERMPSAVPRDAANPPAIVAAEVATAKAVRSSSEGEPAIVCNSHSVARRV